MGEMGFWGGGESLRVAGGNGEGAHPPATLSVRSLKSIP